jgi:hypothetical protein
MLDSFTLQRELFIIPSLFSSSLAFLFFGNDACVTDIMTARKPKTSASGDYSHGDAEKEGANEKSRIRLSEYPIERRRVRALHSLTKKDTKSALPVGLRTGSLPVQSEKPIVVTAASTAKTSFFFYENTLRPASNVSSPHHISHSHIKRLTTRIQASIHVPIFFLSPRYPFYRFIVAPFE